MELVWYKTLYLGDTVKKKSKRIRNRIDKEKYQPGDIRVITLASNPQNLLDIVPANELRQPYLRKSCPPIVGLAGGQREAEEIVRQIVEDTYGQRRDTNVREYLHDREYAEIKKYRKNHLGKII